MTKIIVCIFEKMKFKFNAPQKPTFSCNLECNRCTATAENGQRCKLRTCIGVPLCWIHNRKNKHLAIKPSTIAGAGKGLFAIRTKTKGLTQAQKDAPIFKKDQVITKYEGQEITNAELRARYDKQTPPVVEYTAPYAFAFRHNDEVIIVDSACKRGIAALANAKPHNRANAKLTSRGNLTATKNIRDGQEIFTSYGKSYKMNEPTSYSTK